jgi:hypothetical protein
VFGTFSDETPAIEDFIGPEVLTRFDRILGGRKIEIIGRFVEVLPNNWKMYAETSKPPSTLIPPSTTPAPNPSCGPKPPRPSWPNSNAAL